MGFSERIDINGNNLGPIELRPLYQFLNECMGDAVFDSFPAGGTIIGENKKNGCESFVFYNYGAILLASRDSTEQINVKKLEENGFHILEDRLPSQGKRNFGLGLGILWEHLRKGPGRGIIRRNLDNLLGQILPSYRGVRSFEFAVYNPEISASTDEIDIPRYIRYEESFRLPADDKGAVDVDPLVEKIMQMPLGRALAISSRVETPHGERHIPLVDFKTLGVNYYDILNVMKRLQMPNSFLVSSSDGSFHHYWPSRLMAREEFMDYLWLMENQEEVGRNWPGLQRAQEYSLLRISPARAKPYFPGVIEETEVAEEMNKLVGKNIPDINI